MVGTKVSRKASRRVRIRRMLSEYVRSQLPTLHPGEYGVIVKKDGSDNDMLQDLASLLLSVV